MARPKKQPIDPLLGKLGIENIELSKPQKKQKQELNVEDLFLDAISLISSELEQIKNETCSGKLLPELSRDLVSYTKLLYEIKQDSNEAISEYTDEQLLNMIGH